MLVFDTLNSFMKNTEEHFWKEQLGDVVNRLAKLPGSSRQLSHVTRKARF